MRRARAGQAVYFSPMDTRVLPPDGDSAAHAADMASDLREIGISKDMEALLERGLHSVKLPKALRGAKAAEAFQATFEIIGGVPRLAMWADKNPDKFYQLFGRMIPQTIAPVLPEPEAKQAQEWPEWLTARRLAYQESQKVAEDIKFKEPTKLPR